MKQFLLASATLLLCPTLRAQDTNPNLHHWVQRFTRPATWAYKVNDPTLSSDYFSVDLGSLLNGATLTALQAEVNEKHGRDGTVLLGIVENCAPGVPNLNAALTTRTGRVPRFSGLTERESYSLPCLPAGSPTYGYSVTITFPPGDSHCWLVADDRSQKKSSSTTTAFGGCQATRFSPGEFLVAVGVHPGVGLFVDGGTSATVEQDHGEACLVFHGPAPRTPGTLFLLSPVISPLITLVTDAGFPGPCPRSWALCDRFSCADSFPGPLLFGHFYLDFTDRRPNGKPKWKLATASLDVHRSDSCTPRFGQRDDCVLESTIWKVQNPSGPSDWFSVNQGAPDGSGASFLTGLEVSSWDFCGTGPSWAEIGVYPANLALDPQGCTPDRQNPLSSNGGSTASMAPNSGDWGCPFTFYDLPRADLSSGTIYHTAVHWPASDTCIWLGSDTDASDSSRAAPLPNNGCCSLFSLDSFATPALPFPGAHLMIQMNWH